MGVPSAQRDLALCAGAATAGAVAATAPITLGTTTVSPHALKKAVSKGSTPAESALAAYRYCTHPMGHAPMTHTCGSLTHSNTPVDNLCGGRSEDSTAEYVACCAMWTGARASTHRGTR